MCGHPENKQQDHTKNVRLVTIPKNDVIAKTVLQHCALGEVLRNIRTVMRHR